MPASSRLSVEIWQTILRYAIAVADFLDTDLPEDVLLETLYKDARAPESVYWKAEKTRNCLQLVSKSWDEYLRRFEHRYVRMTDIQHGKVEPNKLRNAKRIAFNICVCSICYEAGQFEKVYRDALCEVESLDAQIVDMGPEMSSLLSLESYASKFAHVSTLYAQRCAYPLRLIQLIDVLPNLRRVYNDQVHGWTPPPMREHLTAQNVHTLVLRFPVIPVSHDSLTLELPELRNLVIRFDIHANVLGFKKDVTLHILRAVGRQLRSLHLNDQAEPSSTLGEVWELCPRLETFHTRYPLTPSPPHFHPIHTLVVGEKFQLKELKPPPDWPNLRRVIMNHGKGIAAFDDWGTLSVATRAGVRVEDALGRTLEDYKTKGI